MNERWVSTTLGQIAHINPESTNGVEADRVIKYVDLSSVSAGRGIDESLVAEYKFRHAPGRARRLVRKGDVLVSTVRPYLRGSARVEANLDGQVASTGFAVLRAGKGIEPGFLWLLARSDGFVTHLVARATGSNYPAVRPPDVASFPVLLPPPSEQRRVVDLAGAVEEAADAVSRLVVALQKGLNATREEALQADFRRGRMSDLIERIDAGRSPAGVNRLPTPTERAVLKVSAIRPGFFDKNEVKVVPESAHLPEGSRVREGDILVSRANTQELAGIACRVGAVPENYYLCDKTLRLVPGPEADAGFLLEVLLSSDVRIQMRGAATGTSGSMKNISQAKLREMVVPVPSLEEQRSISSLLMSFRNTTHAATANERAVSLVRQALVDELLEGTRRLPPSYNRFLEAV